MKQVLALVACAGLLAACGNHDSHTAPATAAASASAASAATSASSPKITYAPVKVKPAAYVADLKPAPHALAIPLSPHK